MLLLFSRLFGSPPIGHNLSILRVQGRRRRRGSEEEEAGKSAIRKKKCSSLARAPRNNNERKKYPPKEYPLKVSAYNSRWVPSSSSSSSPSTRSRWCSLLPAPFRVQNPAPGISFLRVYCRRSVGEGCWTGMVVTLNIFSRDLLKVSLMGNFCPVSQAGHSAEAIQVGEELPKQFKTCPQHFSWSIRESSSVFSVQSVWEGGYSSVSSIWDSPGLSSICLLIRRSCLDSRGVILLEESFIAYSPFSFIFHWPESVCLSGWLSLCPVVFFFFVH